MNECRLTDLGFSVRPIGNGLLVEFFDGVSKPFAFRTWAEAREFLDRVITEEFIVKEDQSPAREIADALESAPTQHDPMMYLARLYLEEGCTAYPAPLWMCQRHAEEAPATPALPSQQEIAAALRDEYERLDTGDMHDWNRQASNESVRWLAVARKAKKLLTISPEEPTRD